MLAKLTAIPALLALGYAIVLAARLAHSANLARQDTIPALSQALRAFPGNADYHARMSDLDPARAAAEIRLALNLNPWRTEFWIAQATIQELNLDPAASEKSLLEAARVGRYYVPRWALANFYYRRRDPAQFRPWARAALEAARTAADVPSILQMSRKLGLSPDDVRRGVLPDRPDVQQIFIQDLLRDKNWDQLYLVARKLASIGSPDHRDTILASSEALYDAGRIGLAVDLWNSAARQHWIPYPPLNPSAGLSLTNGAFTLDPLPAAFDWKIRGNADISAVRLPSTGLRFELSGKQSESCELLSQNIPLMPSRNYLLRVKYRTTGIMPGAGLHWSVLAPPSTPGRPAIAEGPSLSSEDLTETTLAFESPPQPSPLRLSLSYTRAPGTVRVEGQLSVNSVLLTLAPEPHYPKRPSPAASNE